MDALGAGGSDVAGFPWADQMRSTCFAPYQDGQGIFGTDSRTGNPAPSSDGDIETVLHRAGNPLAPISGSWAADGPDAPREAPVTITDETCAERGPGVPRGALAFRGNVDDGPAVAWRLLSHRVD